MKFSVGYQLREDTRFVEDVLASRDRIEEVYFSWGDFPNGRNLQTQQLNTPWESLEKQVADLRLLFKGRIAFNLLFNATCYGAESQSRRFFQKIGDTVDYIARTFSLSSVTTTSPLIAKFIKTNFPDISVRASVNMEIGTVQGMDYLADWFDGYYMKREYNRDFARIRELKAWCDENGKTLHILANSGCLNFCSAHTFHDNLVAHESEIASRDNGYAFEGICHTYLKKPEKRRFLVRDTSFIRPEDVSLYEPYVSSLKLATRVSPHPSLILKSYLAGRFSGNILELLEPNHAGYLYPFVLENGKLENSYLFCGKNCETCTQCVENCERALTELT